MFGLESNLGQASHLTSDLGKLKTNAFAMLMNVSVEDSSTFFACEERSSTRKSPTFVATGIGLITQCRCTRVKVIRVEVSQNVVHARTTGWMTSTRPGKLRDFGLQPRRSHPRSRNLFLDLGEKSTWFLNYGGQAKCKLVLVVDS